MKRYSITYVSKKDGVVVDISETIDGEFVRYDDYLKSMVSLQDRYIRKGKEVSEELSGILGAISSVVERL